jgi:hypothetical protein
MSPGKVLFFLLIALSVAAARSSFNLTAFIDSTLLLLRCPLRLCVGPTVSLSLSLSLTLSLFSTLCLSGGTRAPRPADAIRSLLKP